MRRVVLDSCGIDPLVDLPGAFDVVRQAVEAGELELLATHILREEVAAAPEEIRAKKQTILDLAKDEPTGALIPDVSRLDHARLSDETEAIERLRSRNPGMTHANDALIASTSMYEGCALVTDDKRLRKRAAAVGIVVLRPRELLAELGYRAPEQA